MSAGFFKSLALSDRSVSLLVAYPLIAAIYVYRWTFSPLIGNSCRFWPTCSLYAQQALRKHGAFRGSLMTVKRLLRCHPWHEGGYDPVE
ncbi:MAG TPA: membrane protein insertion efficiency factor YidD [Acidobacteriota bacterium]|nr:membrane protein insertion efficiency factor YidD [Acidobacteriota bacterium]